MYNPLVIIYLSHVAGLNKVLILFLCTQTDDSDERCDKNILSEVILPAPVFTFTSCEVAHHISTVSGSGSECCTLQ